jgi:hypothetical protein
MDRFNLTPTLHNSPSPVSSDSLPEHDPMHFEDGFNDEGHSLNNGDNLKRKSRRPPSTAERRATHNAVERARRESLNGRFMDLASSLPNMANVKRPSKSVIVAKCKFSGTNEVSATSLTFCQNTALEFVQGAQSREQYLMGQNDALRQEINELRARLGMPVVNGSPLVLQGAQALPVMDNRTRKASSVSSSTGNESPHMSTPSSLGSFVEGQPAPPSASFAFNQVYASAFPPRTAQQAPQQAAPQPNKDNNATPVPATAAPFHRGVDVNYLMALSLQQQQQQHNLMQMQQQNLAASQAFQMPPWLMPHAGTPCVI